MKTYRVPVYWRTKAYLVIEAENTSDLETQCQDTDFNPLDAVDEEFHEGSFQIEVFAAEEVEG